MHGNNTLDDSPYAHPSLIDDPQQHDSGRTAVLDSYASYSNSPQAHLNSPRQALQLPRSTHEKLDDVSTWNMDTIRQVAMDIGHQQGLALFDLQDHFSPTTPETTPLPTCGWNDDEYDRNDVAGADGAVGYEQESLFLCPSVESHAALHSGSAASRPRKLKMHEWPPQSDPEKEKRRKGAVRQKLQREKEQKEIQELQKTYNDSMREVGELAPERTRLQQQVQLLEQYAAQQGIPLELLKNFLPRLPRN